MEHVQVQVQVVETAVGSRRQPSLHLDFFLF
jgi:hypothetical protein